MNGIRLIKALAVSMLVALFITSPVFGGGIYEETAEEYNERVKKLRERREIESRLDEAKKRLDEANRDAAKLRELRRLQIERAIEAERMKKSPTW